jgi:hypothetical protein
MDKKKLIQSIILLVVGALFMLIQNPFFGWGGVVFQIIGIYGLISVYKPEMRQVLKILFSIAGGAIFSLIAATILSFLLY